MRLTIARTLDRLAAALMRAGRRVGGELGYSLADRIAMACIAPAANLTGVPCTCGTEHD